MKAKITLPNIKHFLQGYGRSFLKSFGSLPKHIEEQYYYRIEQVKTHSLECLEQGKCKVCGCSTPELFLSSKSCENNPPCYSSFLEESDWESFKNQNSI